MLFLHGALSSSRQFSSALKQWPAEAPDLPGHGAHTPDIAFSLPLFAQSVLRHLDEKGVEKTAIFGYSMGGYVALYLAAHFPEKVANVTTLGTKLAWDPEVAAGMNRMFDPEKIEAKVPQFAAQLAGEHADWKALCRYTTAFLSDLGNGLGLSDEEFGRIQCPVTIGWGEQDNVVSENESRRVAGLIPGGQFIALPGVKHQFEWTEQVEGLIRLGSIDSIEK